MEKKKNHWGNIVTCIQGHSLKRDLKIRNFMVMENIVENTIITEVKICLKCYKSDCIKCLERYCKKKCSIPTLKLQQIHLRLVLSIPRNKFTYQSPEINCDIASVFSRCL